MDQRDPREDQRRELDREPHETPEPTTPPSPVPPVQPYRPPRTTPFRTSALGGGGQPDPAGADTKPSGRPPENAHRDQPEAGSAFRSHAGDGHAYRSHEGAGHAYRTPEGAGHAYRSQEGADSAHRTHAGTGSAYGSHEEAGEPQGTRPGPEYAERAEPHGDWYDDERGSGTRPPHGSFYNPPPPPPPKKQKQRSIVGPLLLIFLGLFFLGQSLGLIHWSLWEVIWRLWPVWLIVAGLDMLFGKQGGWGRVVAVVAAIVLVGAIVLGVRPLHVAEPRTEPVSIAQPLDRISSAEIRVESSVSSLRIQGETMSDYLVQGSVVPLISEEIQWGYNVVGDRGVFRLYSKPNGPLNSNGSGRGNWDLVLTDALPLSLDLDLGVGESHVDLSRLNVQELDVDAGVGQVTITLPEQGALTGRINAGVGEVIIRVAKGRPARIQVETGLGGSSADDGFQRQNGHYVTPEYRDGADDIDLFVSGGVGAVRLVTYD